MIPIWDTTLSLLTAPPAALLANGYAPGNTIAAQHYNYQLYHLTKELNAVLTAAGVTQNAAIDTQLTTAIESLITSQNVIKPMSGTVSGNTSYLTIPTAVGMYHIYIPAADLVAASGGPWTLTLGTGSGTTVIVPIAANGDTLLSGALLFNIYVDASGNVTGDAFEISGSNANGSWIKFGDGTMNLRGWGYFKGNGSTQQTVLVSLPVSFIDTQFDSWTTMIGYTSSVPSERTGANNQITDTRFSAVFPYSVSQLGLNVYANGNNINSSLYFLYSFGCIGKWK